MGERKNIPRKKNSRGWFLSFEERKRIEELLDTGTSTKQISLILGKSQGTIFARSQETGDIKTTPLSLQNRRSIFVMIQEKKPLKMVQDELKIP